MKLWSPRLETNASVRTSGDHTGDSLLPRAKNAASGGLEPSIGAIQTRRSRTNATRVPSGEIAGSSPSTSSRGADPAAECYRYSQGTALHDGVPSARLDAQHRALVLVGDDVEQAVGALLHVANALPQIREQRLAAQLLHLLVEQDAVELAGSRDLPGP